MPEYDPLLTMAALNMAVVSLHRITSTWDRLILDQEYSSIINNIRMGEINADQELTGLYQEIVRVINSGRLREEERTAIERDYTESKRKGIKEIISGNVTSSYNSNPLKWLGKLAVSCVSEYFTSKVKGEINYSGERLRLMAEELDEYDELQRKLLGSSWTLLRQYNLSDSYRLIQNGLEKFYAAMQELNPSKRNRMLKYIEGDFAMYSPYWFYCGRTVREAGDLTDAKKCFDRFGDVWRPVLRKDPYKVEALKFRIEELMQEENHGTVLECLAEMRENTPLEDWSNNIYMGMMYFALGMKDKAEECVMCNLDFGFETEASGALMEKFSKETPPEIPSVTPEKVIQLPPSPAPQKPNPQPQPITVATPVQITPPTPAKPKRLNKKLLQEHARRGGSEAQYQLARIREKQHLYSQHVLGELILLALSITVLAGLFYIKFTSWLWCIGVLVIAFLVVVMYYDSIPSGKRNNNDMLGWYRAAAVQGHAEAQYRLGRNYSEAFMWFTKAAGSGHPGAREKLRTFPEKYKH